jgi:hypothetical protein
MAIATGHHHNTSDHHTRSGACTGSHAHFAWALSHDCSCTCSPNSWRERVATADARVFTRVLAQYRTQTLTHSRTAVAHLPGAAARPRYILDRTSLAWFCKCVPKRLSL